MTMVLVVAQSNRTCPLTLIIVFFVVVFKQHSHEVKYGFDRLCLLLVATVCLFDCQGHLVLGIPPPPPSAAQSCAIVSGSQHASV